LWLEGYGHASDLRRSKIFTVKLGVRQYKIDTRGMVYRTCVPRVGGHRESTVERYAVTPKGVCG
jgi:hypothetical protein